MQQVFAREQTGRLWDPTLRDAERLEIGSLVGVSTPP